MKFFTLLLVFVLIQIAVFAQNTVSTKGIKYVLLEHLAGTWNGLSVDAVSRSDKIKVIYPVTIIARHHYNDGMVQPYTQQYYNAFDGQGYPSGTVDRKLFVGEKAVSNSRAVWQDYVLIQSFVSPTFDVDLTYSYDSLSRKITATVEAKALSNLQGQYAVNLFIVEDSVTGIGAGFDQKNAYDTTAGHTYNGAGNPITGFVHMNIVRSVLGGVFGDQVLANPAVNTVGKQMYSYTIPVNYNARQVRLIAFVAKYTPSNAEDCEVQNSIQTDNDLYCAYLTPQEKLCMATVDTTADKNVLVWDSANEPVKEYRVYKENAGSYQFIGAVPWGVNRYMDATTVPGQQSNKYKLTIVDSCDKELDLDSAIAHATIHLSYALKNSAVPFISWTPYVGNSILSYVVKRSNNGGIYKSIATLSNSATSYVDTSLPVGGNKYRVEAELKTVCNAGVTPSKYVYSNTVAAWPTQVPEMLNRKVEVVPNPASDFLHIKGIEKGVCNLKIYSMMGQKLLDESATDRRQLDIKPLPSGLYILLVSKGNLNYVIRFRKQ